MANIKAKNINSLKDWDAKELRKLKITIKNRMSSLEISDKGTKPNHVLYGKTLSDCNVLLEKVLKAEKNLSAS